MRRARSALPAHCLVEGTIDPRAGVGGQEFGIGFQLRLPDRWNGRFLFQGGGGLNGWARLFLVPGMGHCGGGPALDDFDPLAAIEAWVERGEAPDRLAARGTAFPGRSRPLCPCPLEARHDGAGDARRADSFACRPPGP